MKMKNVIIASALVALGTPVFAADIISGDQITKLISGNTVQGSMLDSGAYSEFYAKDGTIKAKGYSGKWSVKADTMCFQYGTDPENCWQVEVDHDQVSWVRNGKSDGTGTVVPGNFNNY